MPAYVEKVKTFRALHDAPGTFVIPNPWDAGSARMLTGLGFKALATTSAGAAFTIGKNDGKMTRAEVLANAKAITEASSLPVNGDLENLYADDPALAAETIPLAMQAGLAGCSIEDYSGTSVYEFEHAVARVKAAVAAARSLGVPFVLTARAENLIRGRRDLGDTIKRLQAFETAGADVLYAPGLADMASVKEVLAAVKTPLNVLVSGYNPQLTVAELSAVGVKRISVGGALARAAYDGFLAGAKEIAERGTFTYGQNLRPLAEITALLGKGDTV